MTLKCDQRKQCQKNRTSKPWCCASKVWQPGLAHQGWVEDPDKNRRQDGKAKHLVNLVPSKEGEMKALPRRSQVFETLGGT